MEIRESIRNYIQGELVQDERYRSLSDTEQLIDAGIIDSLGIMKLIGFLEKDLSVTIEDRELIPENFESIDAIVSLVENKRSS